MTKLSVLPPQALLGCDKHKTTHFLHPQALQSGRGGWEKSIQAIPGFMFETLFLCQGRKRADVPKGEPCKSVHLALFGNSARFSFAPTPGHAH